MRRLSVWAKPVAIFDKKEIHSPLNADTPLRLLPPILSTMGAKPLHDDPINLQGKAPAAAVGSGSVRAAARGRREQGPVVGEEDPSHNTSRAPRPFDTSAAIAALRTCSVRTLLALYQGKGHIQRVCSNPPSIPLSALLCKAYAACPVAACPVARLWSNAHAATHLVLTLPLP